MSDEVTSEEFQALVGQFRASLQSLERSGVVAVCGRSSGATLSKPGVANAEAGPTASAVPVPEPGKQTLAQLREDIGDCQRCALSESRKNLCFGTGSESAKLFFVGEAPGAEEDKQGEPFVGPSGQLLDKMIVAMGWTRETVYIANVLKCRPPGNRDPKTDEIASCEGFLARQIHTIGPEVIITLGKPAAHLLLGSTASMGSLRGVWQSYHGVPVMPTYHPAYLLRDPSKKRQAWSDLQQVMARCASLGIKG